MNTPNTGNRAQNPATVETALLAAVSQYSQLQEHFILGRLYRCDNLTIVDCSIVIEEAEKLIATLQTLKQALKDRAATEQATQPDQAADELDALEPEQRQTTTGFNINPPRRHSLAEIMQEQAQQRGLEPMPLESELLLKRIKDGGYSGQYLADAFLSAYRTNQPFPHGLGGLIKLDAEAFRLFHEILHIRFIRGWNDDDLYQLEQRVIALVGGAQ